MRCTLTVVIGRLVGVQDERVALTGVNLYLVDNERLHIHAFDLDDSHVVSINGEFEVGVAWRQQERES